MQAVVNPDALRVSVSELSSDEAQRLTDAGHDPGLFLALDTFALAQMMGWQDVPGHLAMMVQLVVGVPGSMVKLRPSRVMNAQGQPVDAPMREACPVVASVRVLIRRDALSTETAADD